MYACICKAVTVAEAVEAIDGGAVTVESVGERTGAGTSCHTCHDHLEELIESRCGSCPLAVLALA
jgi:bacterioferritin-associated ferredoxin